MMSFTSGGELIALQNEMGIIGVQQPFSRGNLSQVWSYQDRRFEPIVINELKGPSRKCCIIMGSWVFVYPL